MRFNIKKITSVIASALMLGSTMGIVAAAAYPAPFVVSGAGNGAVVYGTGAAGSDITAAVELGQELDALVTTTGGVTSVTGDAWQVASGSDKLEIGEIIKDVRNHIGAEQLDALGGGSLSAKGNAVYKEYMYFPGGTSVNYTIDDEPDPDEIGLFYEIPNDVTFAEYIVQFTSFMKSDVTTNTVVEDIEDKDITLIGRTYTITDAVNGSAGIELTLMGGANKAVVSNDEEVTVGGKAVSVVVTATDKADFTVEGETKSTGDLAEGGTFELSDGTFLGVTDIKYQNFAGGLMQATFYLGANKLLLKNASDLEVNDVVISKGDVIIASTESSGVVSIKQINVTMVSEDQFFIREGGRLSEEEELDYPEVMVTRNWDLQFNGVQAGAETETVKIYPSGSDKKYILEFENYHGHALSVPLVYINNSGVFGGYDDAKKFVINTTGNVTKDDWFFLNSADTTTVGQDGISYLVQYKGTDAIGDATPECEFDVVGVQNSRKSDMTTTVAEGGTLCSLEIEGTTFTFQNWSTTATKDAVIGLTSTAYGLVGVATGVTTKATTTLRTKYNGKINITDINTSDGVGTDLGVGTAWQVELWLDDTDRDGDSVDLTTEDSVFKISLGNTTTDIADTVALTTGWQTDPEDSNKRLFMTTYGAHIEETNPDSSPVTIEVTIPENVVEPLVYMTSGEVSVSSGGTGAGKVLVVTDKEVDTVKEMNLVVVGGSCINTVAADLLGSNSPLCGEGFSAKTNVGAGGYIIQVLASPYAAADSGKVAMLVAGYHAADTLSAVARVKDGVTTDVGTVERFPVASA